MPNRSSLKIGISTLLAIQLGILSNGQLAIAKGEPAAQKQSSDAQSKSEAVPETFTTRLDKKTLKLINKGDWKAAAKRLEQTTKEEEQYTRNVTWLAFAYMFLNRCKSLDVLDERLEVQEDSIDQKTYKMVVQAFSKICSGKSKEAKEILESLPRQHANDCLVNFALAAVSGKNGKAGAAIEYCKRAVELDPNFGWGYRTLGYLQFRWLNQPMEAEKSLAKALEIEPRQDEVRNMLVRSRLGHNDFDGAIAVSKEAIKLDKKNADNYLRLATIYLKQWRFTEAIEELNKAIKLNPDNAVYFRRRAGIKQAQGNMDEAIQDQSKAVALSKDKSFELVELANLNVRAGNVEPAIANLKEALERNPKNRQAHRQLANLLTTHKRWDQLVEEYRRALKNEDKNSNLHYLLADALMKAKKPKEGIAEFTKAANLNNKDPRPLRKLGTYYSENKQYDKAIKAFRRALNINPTSVQDMVALGYCYAQDDNYLQSEAAFVTALALKQLNRQSNLQPPSRQDIIRTLASLLLLEGRYADARNQFRSLYSMTHKTKARNIDAYLLAQAEALSSPVESNIKKMLVAYANMNAKEKKDYRYSFIQSLIKVGYTDKALAQLKDISKEEIAQEPKWNILMARANREAAKYEKAESLIETSVLAATKREDKEPSLVADALVEKARIQLAQGKKELAEESAKHALETYSRAYASYLVLGQINYEREDYEEAISLLKKALEQNPYISEAYMSIGESYMKIEKPKEALENYKKACEINPGSLKGHRLLLSAYEKLEKLDDAKKEKEQIERMEKLK